MKKIYALPALLVLLILASCGVEKNEGIIPEEAMMEKTTETMSKDEAMIKDETMMEKTEDTMIQEDTMMGKMDEVMMEDDAMMEKTEDTVMAKGSYTSYSADMLGKTENTVVFFHANWCTSCRAADAGISAGSIPENLTILKADYDSETELKKKYGVTSQHTFVLVDAQGEMIKKWVGGTSVEDVVGEL